MFYFDYLDNSRALKDFFKWEEGSATFPSSSGCHVNSVTNRFSDGDLIELLTPELELDNLIAEVQNNILTLKYEQKDKKSTYSIGSFTKQWKLSEKADQENISIKYKDGVLKINLKNKEIKKEEPKSITIPIIAGLPDNNIKTAQ